MKWKLIFVVLAVMLMVGCSKPEVVDEPEPVVEIVEEPEPVVEEVVEEPEPVVEEPQATTETITLMDNSAEPTELTVVAGSTIIFESASSKVNIIQLRTVGYNEKSPRLNEGDTWEATLSEPGEYTFVDIIIGRAKGTIIVE